MSSDFRVSQLWVWGLLMVWRSMRISGYSKFPGVWGSSLGGCWRRGGKGRVCYFGVTCFLWVRTFVGKALDFRDEGVYA